ncbi:ATP-binding protein [Streptomyces sp. WAC05374]|uniref:ATP-binding protein n=1 Tax=Streptomyces sp. WAC05374 TaxID=2487420 RepID=UPI000F867E92|nr:ATP-binding protein [Streptomyces sp. WAC05374]RST15635.1 ATP-binding protein [Streptomyces sp. WAC05374]TDF38863.1 ATP-binding protein [Streptomyces sp. WAC05374]TDF46823.1 ATP-binding protein [Streptomyces sp. WAC05374]TDF48773.1 ATP-binding protein [Streptomyces sp. WAC05374]
MDTDGTFEARRGHVGKPPVPPPPRHAPAPAGGGTAQWLRASRPAAEPGVWRFGHRPRPAEEPETVPARRLFAGAVIALLSGWLLWSLLWNGYLGYYWLWPLLAFTPDEWRTQPDTWATASYVYYALVGGGLLVFFARVGHIPEIWRRYARKKDTPPPPPPPDADPVDWPELRDAGLTEAAQRLAEATRSGALGDVDYARIRRAWQGVRTHPDRLPAFTEAVRAHGPAACAHPSGLRDLPVRTAAHDLATAQVRIGTAADHPRNPYARRTTGVALEPAVLGTSLLAVGPAGSGKTVRLVRPVVESLCLQALANRACVVAVTAHGTALAPDAAFDVIVSVGRPDSTHDLDLYGGADDPDEAARMLAEALVGDLVPDSRRAATALAQLIGPYRAAHGHFPAVPELRELLGGAPRALAELRAAVAGDPAQLRELDARERQAERGDDVGVLLAERVAFLDRPAFARFFRTGAEGRRFSPRAIEHPLRVRVDLPERGHAEASRIVARLLLAQFTEAALARRDRSLFACLVLDDATYTVTADSVRAIQRLRSAHAGVVLALRTLEDVPEALRGPLLGAVGCRMAFAGIASWDGGRFAETWGTEWVQMRDVTNRQIISDEPLTKALHFLRRLVTGKAATAEAVTVREVERQRWSASDLAHGVPPGHAVLSLTGVRGEHVPPLLVDLRT